MYDPKINKSTYT